MQPLSAHSILDILNANADYFRTMGAQKIGVFGSFRHHTDSSESDIDILIDLPSPSFDSYMSIKFFLEDQLGRPVDLVILSDIKPRLKAQI
jgi:predicted nucleotidyltransferase